MDGYAQKSVVGSLPVKSREFAFPLGHAIRYYREKLGLSQLDLAQAVGLERSTITYLEEGKIRRLDLGKLCVIASCLKLDLIELLTRAGLIASNRPLRANGTPEAVFDFSGEGFKILLLAPLRKEIFIGEIILFPRAVVERDRAPHAPFLFYQVLSGLFLFDCGGEECLLREGQHLVFPQNVRYNVSNPAFKDSTALVVGVPSFL